MLCIASITSPHKTISKTVAITITASGGEPYTTVPNCTLTNSAKIPIAQNITDIIFVPLSFIIGMRGKIAANKNVITTLRKILEWEEPSHNR